MRGGKALAIAGVAGLAGLGLVANEAIGDCGREVARAALSDDQTNVLEECLPEIGREAKAEGVIHGPEEISVKPVSREFHFMWDAVEVEMVYPRDDASNDLTKVDYKEKLFNLENGRPRLNIGVSGTRFVADKSFKARARICAKAAEDYTKIDIGKNSNIPESQQVSDFTLEYEHNDPAQPLRITAIKVRAPAITVCEVHIPATTADGKVNDIRRYNEGNVNNGVAETFDYVTDDMAVLFGAARICVREIVNLPDATKTVETFARGAAVEAQGEAAVAPPIITEFGDEAAARAFHTDRYNAQVEEYKKLDKAIFPDSAGSRKDMELKFTSEPLELKQCGTV